MKTAHKGNIFNVFTTNERKKFFQRFPPFDFEKMRMEPKIKYNWDAKQQTIILSSPVNFQSKQ